MGAVGKLAEVVAKWRVKECLDEGECSCHQDCAKDVEPILAELQRAQGPQLLYCGTCNQLRYFVDGKCEMCVRKCSICHKETNPLYMCDEDMFDNQFCVDCFGKVGCREKHGEGCETMVVNYGPTPHRAQGLTEEQVYLALIQTNFPMKVDDVTDFRPLTEKLNALLSAPTPADKENP